MYMLRTRLASFMAGFAAASAASFYFLQREIQTGNRFLSDQAQQSYASLEARISHLEKLTGSSEQVSSQLVHDDQSSADDKHHTEENVVLQH